MKWLLMLFVFIGGIFYLMNQRKEEAINKEKLRLVKADQVKLSEPVLPQKQEKSTALKFSPQTLVTLRALTSDSNEKVRIAAAELLWQMQDDSVSDLIKAMFENETEASTKKQLIDILKKDKNLQSLSLLSEALKDSDKDTRIKAVEAIGTFGTKEAIPALSVALKDYDEEVRLKALKAVDNIRKDIEALRKKQLAELEATQKKMDLKVVE
ncbi:MAG TPA: HEAT repeat domain-containing protein [Elusimicrobiales bacterium]|nr:HEAT repeat domain-containing protein [Elusimicrobiales bacterium]